MGFEPILSGLSYLRLLPIGLEGHCAPMLGRQTDPPLEGRKGSLTPRQATLVSVFFRVLRKLLPYGAGE